MIKSIDCFPNYENATCYFYCFKWKGEKRTIQKNFYMSYTNRNKSLKDCLWKQRTYKTIIGDTVLLSLFIYSTVVCEAAYAPYHRLKRYSVFKVSWNGSMIIKEMEI